jgi:hypothetical protein
LPALGKDSGGQKEIHGLGVAIARKILHTSILAPPPFPQPLITHFPFSATAVVSAKGYSASTEL